MESFREPYSREQVRDEAWDAWVERIKHLWSRTAADHFNAGWSARADTPAMRAFRKMDALAATGEDTPEYRAAFAEWQRIAIGKTDE